MTHSFMLNTNIISDLIRNPKGAVAIKVRQQRVGTLCTSIIVAAELRYGLAKRGSIRLRDYIEEFLTTTLDVLPFDTPADRHYGRIRAELEEQGQTIGSNDFLIAAHACATGTILVTNNLREFSRVPGLKVENWL